MFPVQSLPISNDQRLAALLYGTNPYSLAPLPTGLNANGLPALPPGSLAPPGAAAGQPMAPAGPPPAGGPAGPGPGAGALPAGPAGLPPPPGAGPGPGGPPPDFSPGGMMAMAGLPPPPGAAGMPPGLPPSLPGAPPPGGPAGALPAGGPSGGLPGAAGGAPGALPGVPPGGLPPAGAAPPPGALAAGVSGAGAVPPAGALAAGLPGAGPNVLMGATPALPVPLNQAGFLAQQGNAPIAGPPAFKPLSRGEKIARDIMLGISSVVNPVAGAAMISRAAAQPRLQQEALAQYQAQLPAVQQAANVQAYQEYLKSQGAQAELMKGQAEETRATQQLQLQQWQKFQEQKSTDLMKLTNALAAGTVTPEVARRQGQLLAGTNPLITPAEIDDIIANTPQTGAKYTLKQGPEGSPPYVVDRQGNAYDATNAPADAMPVLAVGQRQFGAWQKTKQAMDQMTLNREIALFQAQQGGLAGPLSPAAQASAQAILEGRMDTPGSFALKTPYWQSVMGEVFRQDPGWNEQRAQLRKAYTVGSQSKEINAINTALGHLGTLNDAVGALNNGNVQALNNIATQMGVQAGKDNVTTFNTIVNRVGPEVAKAYVGAGGSAGERGTTEKDFSSSMSPQQLKSNIGVTADLLRSKISSLENQWNQNAPAGQDFQTRFMMPGAKQALDRIAGGAGGGAGGGKVIPAGATGTAMGSDGKLHYTDGKRDLGVVPQ